jgi:hypothetical protein
MRQFQLSVLDYKFVYEKDFESHPFEVAWASEAIFFIRVEKMEGIEARLTAYAQISADGIHWIDEGTKIRPIKKVGDYFMRVKHFGGFVRMRCKISGRGAKFQLTDNIALKE